MFPTRPEVGLLGLGELPSLLALSFGSVVLGLVLPLIVQPLVELQRRDVVLVALPGGLAARDVGCIPEVSFELLLCQSHLGSGC